MSIPFLEFFDCAFHSLRTEGTKAEMWHQVFVSLDLMQVYYALRIYARRSFVQKNNTEIMHDAQNSAIT